MAARNVPVASAGPRVSDAMLRSPDTLAPSTTVGDARPLLESPKLRMLLVAEGDDFHGAVTRERLEHEPDGDRTLGELVGGSATLRPDDELEWALTLLEELATERLPVVAEDGRLVGLVCFNRQKRHFCVDADQ